MKHPIECRHEEMDVRNRIQAGLNFHNGEEDTPYGVLGDKDYPLFTVFDPKTQKRFRVTIEAVE